ncbi:MAG: hypothetical protein AB7F86_04410 [Bdellovibrionales bacterium]
MMRLTIIILGIFAAQGIWAASPYKKTLSTKKGDYSRDGVFIGGKAGTGTSLLNVRRIFSKKAKLERVIVDLGDHEMQPLGKNMSYFQVNLDSQNNRVVLDLAQLRFSKVSEAAVRRLFQKSPFVKSVSLTMDPEDKAATMVLQLRRPVKLEVYQSLKDRKPARIVMDLIPAVSTGRRSL